MPLETAQSLAKSVAREDAFNRLITAAAMVLAFADARGFDLGGAGDRARVALERIRPGLLARLDAIRN